MTFEAFGVRLTVTAPAAVLPRIENVLPPGWQPAAPGDDDPQFVITTLNGIVYRVNAPGDSVSGSSDLQIALEVLGAGLRTYIALHAPHHIFVHAGVVEHNGRAIVLPGPSFSGKTSLVGELVRAGANYYSDEFAVLDADGLVHPYPKPLSVRTSGVEQVDHDVTSFGGTVGTSAVPVGVVAVTQYGLDGVWSPRRLSPGEAVLAVLANTVPAQERPQESLSVVKRALEPAVVIQSERGDAALVAAELLDLVTEPA